MRITAFIEYAAIVAGVLGVAAGVFFDLPDGVHLGVFLVGLGIALGGFESVATRRMGFRSDSDQWEAYAGAPAVIFGMMTLALGVAAILAARVMAEGAWHATLLQLERRPGPLWIAGGLLAAGAGCLMMLNPRGRRGWAWVLLVRAPRWLLGVTVVLAALAAVALGIMEMADTAAYRQMIAALEREGQRVVRMIR